MSKLSTSNEAGQEKFNQWQAGAFEVNSRQIGVFVVLVQFACAMGTQLIRFAQVEKVAFGGGRRLRSAGPEHFGRVLQIARANWIAIQIFGPQFGARGQAVEPKRTHRRRISEP